MRKKILLTTLGVVTLLLVAGGGRFLWRWMHRPPDTVLPEFSEPVAGPRSLRSDGLSVVVGRSSMSEVQTLIDRQGVTCHDTSARALMKQMREKKIAEIEAKKAKGEEVDAVSGASVLHKKSPKERNPQVRLSCEDVRAASLTDRARPPAKGRLLYIFDSPDHPLRHVSYRRVHRDPKAALADVSSALEALTALYGPPLTSSGPLPVASEGIDPALIFPLLKTLKYEWRYADLLVQLTALNFGKRGIDVLESIEVPWPVRSDAPALPALPASAASSSPPSRLGS